jgi:hypothetical protein
MKSKEIVRGLYTLGFAFTEVPDAVRGCSSESLSSPFSSYERSKVSGFTGNSNDPIELEALPFANFE